MDPWRQVDGYCERTGPDYWSEPVNAVTNLAFVLAALLVWRMARGDALGRALCVILGTIGVGSWLFHTHATVWAAILDVAPIAAFVLVYLYAMNRHGWGVGVWPALGLTALFFPWTAMLSPLLGRIAWMQGAAGYAPIVILIALYAVLLARRDPVLARGLGIGAGILAVSLTFRSLDLPLCAALPLGTHFLWHLLNAVMLGWMIVVYARLRRRQSMT